MTETEQKALALVNEVRAERGEQTYISLSRSAKDGGVIEALCRALEQHEAFKREVSDAAEQAVAFLGPQSEKQPRGRLAIALAHFIIPKPDPLVEAINNAPYLASAKETADHIRAALAARGLEVRKIGEGQP